MLNKDITIAGNRITKQENFLVNYTVFYTFWSFFTGFPIAFNGIFRTMLGGRLELLIILSLFFVYVVSLASSPKSFSNQNLKYALSYSLALIFLWAWMIVSVSEADNSLIVPLFCIPFFILLRDDLKIVCLDRYMKVLAIVLTFSLAEYIIYLLFHQGILLYSNIGRVGFENEKTYVFDQYLFNIYFLGQDYPRFQSLCEEPGCIGTICGFLLYATRGRKEYKYQYYIFILAGIFSFSLAFFALFALHFFLNAKKSYKTLFFALVLLACAFYAFAEIFQDLLLYRIQGGFLNADNRLTDDFSTVYAKAAADGDLWLPHGSEKGSFGAGAKMWIWRYGIISFIIVFFTYYYCYWQKAKTYKAPRWACMVFFLAFWMSFYQRHWIMNIDYIIIFLSIPIIYAYQSRNERI